MPKRLAEKLMLSLTILVVIVAAVSGLVGIKAEERQLLNAMILGADQLSKGITSATWHAMLADHRQDAYQVMETIALKQGIDRIWMFNRSGRIVFSTNPEDMHAAVDIRSETCAMCHAPGKVREKLDLASRVRIYRRSPGRRNLAMVTPIYNEPSCSQAACHAHPANQKVLGVVDVGLRLDNVDAEVASMKIRVLARAVIEIVLMSLFIIYFTRRFVSRPISQLVAGTKAISQMELDKPIEVIGGSQEIDQLARSFDTMRHRLKEARDEINEFTQKLESKVEERTRQLRAAQQKLQQSDRLASLGQLAASVAHEINNPISGVLNLSMLMQRLLKDDGIPAGRLEDFRKYLGQVTHETSRVGRIVSDLLAFSRRSKPQRSMADLNKIVASTMSLVSHKLKLSNVAANLRLAPDLPAVSCDSSQIQQVLVNLVLNAAESMQSRGQGEISIETSLDRTEGMVLLRVSDSGEGIREENLARIFDPFFTTKSEGKGVGLGLAVSYGIIQAHGGDIEVKSRIGQGTTFTVSLPLGEPGHGSTAPALAAYAPGG
jgi:two-component system, NtrC family, sensor kinase